MKKLSGRQHLVAVATSHLQQSSQVPVENWCRRRDLNPHGLRHTPLKRACLPFHHFGLGNVENAHQLRSWSPADRWHADHLASFDGFQGLVHGHLNVANAIQSTVL